MAAHAREGVGTLRLWDIALNAKTSSGDGSEDRPLEPFQTEYLPTPLTGVAFNPVHNTQLLATASPHAVRIYDYSVPSIPPERHLEGPFPSQGSWLLSLYPPFARGSLTPTARKPIVGAAWIVHGRAVLTLLADGQWGIWDIEGTGPALGGAAPPAVSSARRARACAARRSRPSARRGSFEGTSPLRNPAVRRPEGDFMPMTPHTRRDALASSLAGGAEETGGGPRRRGGSAAAVAARCGQQRRERCPVAGRRRPRRGGHPGRVAVLGTRRYARAPAAASTSSAARIRRA